MEEYIKREDAINLLWLYADESCASVVSDFESLPAVPVVRCQECRYYPTAKVNEKGFLICPASGMEITETDYCSYGERMDKEDET